MIIFPAVRSERFNQLKVGELFIYADGHNERERFYALKVQALEKGDEEMMIPLGPELPAPLKESFLLQWQASTVLSLGTDFRIVLPSEPSTWTTNGPNRDPICLAVSKDQIYACVNSANHPSIFAPVYANMKTGELCKRLPGTAVFTNSWAIHVGDAKGLSKILVQYPLKQEKDAAAAQ